MAALICIKNVRGTFCELVNIANRFLRIFSNLETLIRFIYPGGAGYPYLPTQLIVFMVLLSMITQRNMNSSGINPYRTRYLKAHT